MSPKPLRVFLSYTAEDLHQHARAVAAALRTLYEIDDHVEWPANGRRSVAECRRHVGDCDVLVVLVAHRYGWVPTKEEQGDGERSITWLEVEEARKLDRPVLSFLVDPKHPWSPDHIEKLSDAVAGERLERFKAVLNSSIRAHFTTPESASTAVLRGLQSLTTDKPSEPPPPPPPPPLTPPGEPVPAARPEPSQSESTTGSRRLSSVVVVIAVAALAWWMFNRPVLKMIRIPGGDFEMGGEFADSATRIEYPPHPVTVPAFYLAETEVTRGQWRDVMRDYPKKPEWNEDCSDDQLPANFVTWEEANEFCKRLSKDEGLDEGRGYRLPSEAEWEYACRAGTTTVYSFEGDETRLEQFGWYELNALGRVHPVGKRDKNPWGLHDMHGNVFEWCKDSAHVKYDDSKCPTDGGAWEDDAFASRVIRGGSFMSSAGALRSAWRDAALASTKDHRDEPQRYSFVGFRPARSVTAD